MVLFFMVFIVYLHGAEHQILIRREKITNINWECLVKSKWKTDLKRDSIIKEGYIKIASIAISN